MRDKKTYGANLEFNQGTKAELILQREFGQVIGERGKLFFLYLQ